MGMTPVVQTEIANGTGVETTIVVNNTPSTPEQWHDCSSDVHHAQMQVLMSQMSALQAAFCEQRATLLVAHKQLQSSEERHAAMALEHERETQEYRQQISSLLLQMQPLQERKVKKVKPGKWERKKAKLDKQTPTLLEDSALDTAMDTSELDHEEAVHDNTTMSKELQVPPL